MELKASMSAVEPHRSEFLGEAFRFFDLPAEIRHRIYNLVVDNLPEKEHYLGRVRMPALTTASRQFRDEILPVFFANHTFVLIIYANYDQCRFARDNRTLSHDHLRRLDNRRKAAGTTGLASARLKTIRQLEDRAAFRNVSFHIYGSLSATHGARSAARHGKIWVGMSACSLKFATTSLSVASMGMTQEIDPYYGSFPGKRDLQALLADAGETAQAIRKRDGFVGFTLSDLDTIAKAFRFDGLMAL